MSENALKALVLYSIAMVSLPIVAYFASRNIFELLTNKQSANIYSAICAVVVVHIILFGFVYKAFKEDKQYAQEKTKVADKTD